MSENLKKAAIAELIAQTRDQVDQTSVTMGPPADSIPGYEIRSEIHRGGQGVVYLAHQKATQRDVAIKMMREGPFAGAGERARFEREAQILASIKHPNIVAIHDSGHVGGNYFFVMDYIAGRPLDAWADALRNDANGRSGVSPAADQVSTTAVHGEDLQQLLATFTKICDAVAVAHQRGIIHRDLKPTNIRIDDANEPYVLDFGLAKSVLERQADGDTDGGHREITATGQFLGTLPWASPEQVSTASHLADVRSDVYALGLMLYRSLTGKMPYRTDAALADMVQVIANKEPVKPSVYHPGLDRDLETITLKCLQKDQDRRYQSAGELAADLRRFANVEPVLARPDSGWYTARMFARRHRGLVASAIAIVGLLTASSVALSLLYAKAKRSESLALQNEALANQRAAETKQVAEFQTTQLSQIDIEKMGAQLHDQLKSAITMSNSALSTSMETPEAATGESAAKLESLLAQLNMTDVAKEMLNQNVFATAIKAAGTQFADQPLMRAELLESICYSTSRLGLYDTSIMAQREALELRRGVQGDDHIDVLEGQLSLVRSLLSQASTDEALELASDTVRRFEESTGPSNSRTLMAKLAYGKALFLLGKYDESLEAQRAAYEGLVESVGLDHVDTLDAGNSLASLLHNMQQFDESIALQNHVLDAQQQTLGPDHPKTMSTMHNVASIYLTKGDYPRAIEAFAVLVPKLKKVKGTEHRQTLDAISSYCRAVGLSGDRETELEMLEELIALRTRVSGPLHKDTLSTMGSMGNSLNQLGRTDEALEIQTEVVAGFRATLGDEHPTTMQAVDGLANCLNVLGRLDEAAILFKEAIEWNRRFIGKEHAQTLVAVGNYGKVLMQQGKNEEAEPLLKEASEGMSKVLGPDHLYTISFAMPHAEVLFRLGRFEDALSKMKPTLTAYEKTLGADHRATMRIVLELGLVYQNMKRYDESLAMFEDGVARYRSAKGDKHPHTLTAIWRLGMLLEKMEAYDEALAAYRECREGRIEALGPEHVDSNVIAGHMGLVLAKQGEFSDAIPLLWDAALELNGNEEYRKIQILILKQLMNLDDDGELAEFERYDAKRMEQFRAELNELSG